MNKLMGIGCRYIGEGACCFRNCGFCIILADTHFADGHCHFRKETFNGPNQYDKWRHEQEKAQTR